MGGGLSIVLPRIDASGRIKACLNKRWDKWVSQFNLKHRYKKISVCLIKRMLEHVPVW